MSHQQPLSGQALIADYQTVFVSTATVQAANYEADRSEQQLVTQLETLSAGSYLNPQQLPAADQDALTRASLDAHIKKVQTQQLSAMNAGQLQQLIATDQSLYVNRKVVVHVQTTGDSPIELLWFDQQNGYRSGVSKKKTFTGIIDEVILDKNVLVLRPTWSAQLLNNRLQKILVYIIDPITLKPMVSLTIN
jgi:hypothetical protein